MKAFGDRVSKLIEFMGMTKHSFANQCGIAPTNLNKMIAGEQNVSTKTIYRIVQAFPQISRTWLQTGEGEMLSIYSNSDDYFQDDSSELVPLLPIEAIAGSLQGFSEGVELASCQKIKSPVRGADWAIQISGDSMEPDYRNGSYLFIKKMSGGMIPWGQTLVIDTQDGVVVKNIFPYNDEYIEARSINPKYPPFQIEKSIVLGMYRVLGGTFINSTI